MAPKIIWPRSIAWEILDMHNELKEEAEQLAAHNHPSKRAAALWRLQKLHVDLTYWFEKLPESNDPDVLVCRKLYTFAKYELVVSCHQLWQMFLVENLDAERQLDDKPEQLPSDMEGILLSLRIDRYIAQLHGMELDEEKSSSIRVKLTECLRAAEKNNLLDNEHSSKNVPLGWEALFFKTVAGICHPTVRVAKLEAMAPR